MLEVVLTVAAMELGTIAMNTRDGISETCNFVSNVKSY